MARIDRIGEVLAGTLRTVESMQVARRRIEWMVNSVERGPVLDLGCSQGPASILAGRRGFEVVGFDSVEASLDEARRVLETEPNDVQKRVRFISGLGERLPFDDGAFASVVLGETLEHLERPGAVLNEISRVLSENGQLILTVPFGFLYHPDHRRSVVPTELFGLLSQNFRIEHLHEQDGYLCCRSQKLRGGESNQIDDRILVASLQLTEKLLVEVQRNLFFRSRQIDRLESEMTSARRRVAKLTHIAARQRERLAELEPLAFARSMTATKLAYAEYRLRRAGSSIRKNIIEADPEKRSSTVRRWLARTRPSSQPTSYSARLQVFLDRVRSEPSEEFIVIYSGTREIEPHRVNRPGQLAKEFVRRGIPVLFSFYRSHESDEVPTPEDPLLFQSPLFRTEQYIERIASSVHKPRKTFIVSFPHPSVLPFLNRLHAHGWRVIYDCRDEWEAFSNVQMANWYDRPVEAWLVNNVHRTFCVSPLLVRKMRGFSARRPVELSPNAWDPHTLQVQVRPHSRTDRVVVGYFGHLTEKWFDYELVRMLARRRPSWNVRLIGFGAPASLELPGNVSITEAVPPSRLADATRDWRAAMIPFKPGPLARAVDPIKVYDYLALGLPTVSRVMGKIDSYPYVICEDDPERFISGLDQAIDSRPDLDVVSDFLSRNRWADRASRILQSAAEDASDPLGSLAE